MDQWRCVLGQWMSWADDNHRQTWGGAGGWAGEILGREKWKRDLAALGRGELR